MDDQLDMALGARIDALEGALNAYAPDNAESQMEVRLQVSLARGQAERLQLPAVATAADRAYRATAGGLRDACAVLLAQLRSTARTRHGEPAAPEPGEGDPPTGLLNRAGFLRHLERIEHEDHQPFAVAAIHVENHASVCHRHGEDIGLLLLAHVARLIAGQLRQDDRVARFGGDEFMLLLPGEDARGLHAALARIEADLLRHPFRLPGGGGRETVRITSCGHYFQAGGPAPAQDIKHNARVGLVAHDPAMERTLRSLLLQHGCELVDPGTSAASPYAAFAHHGVTLVILDAGPGDLALELFRLRAVLSHDRTPVLVLASNDAAAHWSIEQGACEALVKPVALETLRRTACRLATRGRREKTAASAPAAGTRVLVASESLGDLIALGSALQHAGGYEVGLARGHADAMEQVRVRPPSATVVDLPLQSPGTQELLAGLAGHAPDAPVMLITDADGSRPGNLPRSPRIAGVLDKPVTPHMLAGAVLRATGAQPCAGHTAPGRTFRTELLRVMRKGGQRAAP